MVEPDRSRRRRARALLAAVLLATALVFVRALGNGWTSMDDEMLVLRNPVQERFGLRELREAFDPRVPRLSYGLHYTPLVDLSHALDRLLFGTDAHFHHLQGLVLHGVSTAAVFVLVGRLGGSPTTAALAALAFAIHPLQTEAVAWVSGRTAVVAGAFLLWALVAWHGACVRGSRRAEAVTLLLVVLSNLSKQTAVVAWLLLGAVEWTAVRLGQTPRRPWTRLVRSYAPQVAVGVGFVLLGVWVGRRDGLLSPYAHDAGAEARVALLALRWYGTKLVWPAGLLPSYDFQPPASWTDPAVLGGLAIVLAWLGLLLRTRRRAPLASFGLVVAAVAILPGAAAVGKHVVAPRYAYVAIAGACIAAAVGFDAMRRRAPVAATAIAVGGAIALGSTTFARVGAWHDDLALFGDAAAREPTKPLWHHLLGRALRDTGRPDQADAELTRARQLAGGRGIVGFCELPPVLGEMARIREEQGDLSGAEEAFVSALDEARPGEVDRAGVELGAFYLRHDEREKARAAYARAVAREPDDTPLSRYRLAWVEALVSNEPLRLRVSPAFADNSPVSGPRDLDTLVRDPRNHILWVFYYSKEDPRLIVPKATLRPGWTINFAHPWAIPALIFGFAFAVGPAILLDRSGYATPLRMAIVVALTIAGIVLSAQWFSRVP